MSAPGEDLAQRRLERWTETATQAVLDELRSTTGGRNQALLRAAVRFGAFARHRLVDEASAERDLLSAAESNGYLRKDGQRTALNVIRRGLRHGLEHGELPAEIEELARGWTPTSSSPETRRSEALPKVQPPPATPPPMDEVRDTWERATSVLDDAPTRAWLESRRIDPVAVHDANLARVLPDDPLPVWARWGTRDDAPSWRDTAHRLLVPMFDVRARLRSLIARAVGPSDAPKSLAPAGFNRRGLVMADGLARRVLARRPAYRKMRILVAEGEKKHLLHAALANDAAENAPAVLSVDSGSWREDSDIVDAIPDGATIVIRTDPDEAGARYATAIVRSLEERWRRARVRFELREGLELSFDPRPVVRVQEGTPDAR